MSQMKRICLLSSLITILMTGPAPAQTPPDNSESAASYSTPRNSDSNSESDGSETQIRYATSLSGSPLIVMGSNIPSHLFWGATVTGGWDSNPSNTSNISKSAASSFVTLNPYLQFVTNTGQIKSVVQYRSTNTSYGSQYSWQSINSLAANLVVNVTKRLSWDLSAMGSYGQDSVRFLGSNQSVVVGEVSGTGPGSATYFQNAGIVTHADASVGVQYKTSERDSIEIRVGNSYSNYSGLNTKNKITTAGMTYARNLSSSLGTFTYLRDSYYHGYIHCSSYGAGVGLRWRSSGMSEISLSAGPQLNTSECGSQQGIAYTVAFSKRLSDNSQFYLLSARAPGSADIGLGVWQESVSGGYQRRVSSRAEAIFNVSFVANETMPTIPGFHGTYFDCRYLVDFGHGLQGVYNYRGYFSSSDGNQLSRNVAAFAINWTPRAGRLPQ